MRSPDLAVARDLCAYIAASPSPFHAVVEAARRLGVSGFEESIAAANGFVRRGGSIVAWRRGPGPIGQFRLMGAHTDSPNLRVKPHADRRSAGFRQLGVEVYGAVLLNSWLDRDLGLSGRLSVRRDGGTCEVLFRIDRPLLRIPQLAIHLDRDVNERGLVLNRQQHLSPLWGIDDGPDFRSVVADAAGVEPSAVVAWDAMCHDLAAPTLAGVRDEFVSAPRIDNQLSCHAAITALTASPAPPDGVAIGFVLFDHEEVGSTTDRGAAGAFLGNVLERVALVSGCDRSNYLAALARSICVSADCAHGTHPNYVERHEPDHWVALNGGPVIKLNTSARYATESTTAAVFVEACEAADVPTQWFVTRGDVACGSTIGPLTAAQLGMATVDVGVAQLAMHSCREMAGSYDPGWFTAALESFFAR
ncbi:MAG TPA: M18 family aminopeptidase [Acidimicrobiales bacterium]|nr:M18 family aminopeptidase [Acidimicrobiales bacterium]